MTLRRQLQTMTTIDTLLWRGCKVTLWRNKTFGAYHVRLPSGKKRVFRYPLYAWQSALDTPDVFGRYHAALDALVTFLEAQPEVTAAPKLYRGKLGEAVRLFQSPEGAGLRVVDVARRVGCSASTASKAWQLSREAVRHVG